MKDYCSHMCRCLEMKYVFVFTLYILAVSLNNESSVRVAIIQLQPKSYPRPIIYMKSLISPILRVYCQLRSTEIVARPNESYKRNVCENMLLLVIVVMKINGLSRRCSLRSK